MSKPSINLASFAVMATEAADLIAPYTIKTPLEYSPELSETGACKVYLKCECLQNSGSFKIRGAANHILSLSKEEQSRGVITASTGNHAAAFARIVDQLGLKGTIFLPQNASAAKLVWLKQFKVELKLHGSDCIEAELKARQTAEQTNRIYISPYNHLLIMAGQATIGVELADQLPDLQVLFCPVGGGGLAAGVAGFLKHKNPRLKVIGCQPQNSKVMYESIKAGHILDIPSLPTISDGTAGGIEAGSVTFDYCRQLIDDFYLVSEDEIRSAMKLIAVEHQFIIEGSAALSVAGFIKSGRKFSQNKIALILTGRRVNPETLRSILT